MNEQEHMQGCGAADTVGLGRTAKGLSIHAEADSGCSSGNEQQGKQL